MHQKRTLAILTLAIFAVAAAMPASAQPERPSVDAFRQACADGRIDHDRCEAAANTTAPPGQARRAAHHAHEAWEALQDRIVRLEFLEYRARQALGQPNVTANETADLEAKIDRIQNAQDDLIERALALRDRIDGLRDRWPGVRDHLDRHERIVICHVGDDGDLTLRLPLPAAKAHIERHEGDHRGRCADEPGPSTDAFETDDEQASAQQNATTED